MRRTTWIALAATVVLLVGGPVVAVVPGVPPVSAKVPVSAMRANATPGCVSAAEWGRIKARMTTAGIVSPADVARITAAPFKVTRSVRKRGVLAVDTTVYPTCNGARLRIDYEWLSPAKGGWRLRSGGPFPKALTA
ncbi:MAG: hypothetical protein RLZZ403_846 [Pseudomonadota bacterium]|jgi:hypothetical protein